MALMPCEYENDIELYKTLCPAGTRSLGGVLMQSGSVYQIIIYLPIPANKVTISCDEFRPGGQTAVKVTNPSVNTATGNEVIIYTTNSSFASYVGKEAVAHLTFAYS